MEHDKELKEFIQDRVNLGKTRLERAQKTYEAVEKDLKRKFGGHVVSTKPQGSYATNTVIIPGPDKNDEYDIDMLFVLCDGDALGDARAIFTSIEAGVASEKRKVEIKRHCVRINYAGDFHMDIVPCLQEYPEFFLCDSKENTKSSKTDGGAYTDWFNKIDEENGHLVSDGVKLLKYVRDHKNTFSCPSIVLTTLFGQAAPGIRNGVGITEAFVLLLESAALNLYSCGELLENPCLSGENLLRDVQKLNNVKKCLGRLAGQAREAYDEEDEKKSKEKWGLIFDDAFLNLIEDERNDQSSKGPRSINLATATPPYYQP